MIDIIAFDADDTLWHNETLFHLTHEKFSALLSGYHDKEWIERKLFETEMRNLEYFGYGIKGFTLSMIETAIQLTEGRIRGDEIQKIIDFARRMVKAPVELLDHAAETVKMLAESYSLMLITKGDIFDQESKIARSGLSDYFKHIEILSKKTAETYRAVLEKYGIEPRRFVMVGNSLKSDILPILEIGAEGVYIPYPLCWEHEKVNAEELHQKNYHQLENIGQLPLLVNKFAVNGGF
ncbi:MAG: HAD family hydrolase [bacterium]|nr:HAD family hydrolase [bacterium]